MIHAITESDLVCKCLIMSTTSAQPINSIALASSCHVGGGLMRGSHFYVKTAMRNFCGSPRYLYLPFILLSWAWGSEGKYQWGATHLQQYDRVAPSVASQ